jgi:tRNA(Arg) A34 adenosine deaminase TadA
MTYYLDWSDLAFGSKKPLRELGAVFITAPRTISSTRFKQLLKTYLPAGNIVLGLAKEPYILGLEDQDWFRTLQLDDVQATIEKVNAASPQKVYTLSYHQRDLPFILEKIPFKHHVFINGSWYTAFHLRPEYYRLAKQRASYEHVSPFADETEARNYADTLPAPAPPTKTMLTDNEMLSLARDVAKYSLAYSEYQIGVTLGRPQDDKYQLLIAEFNRVVPYQTYAMHHGAARERHFSPIGDQNHYDVNHAEIETIITAGRRGIDLAGTTLFINVLPCPTCARMFTSTDISEFVYSQDHSDGYAVKMLEAAGKKVRRLVS